MTLIELLVVVWSLALGMVFAVSGSRAYAWPGGLLGFLAGLVAIPGMLSVLFWCLRRYERRGASAPPTDEI